MRGRLMRGALAIVLIGAVISACGSTSPLPSTTAAAATSATSGTPGPSNDAAIPSPLPVGTPIVVLGTPPPSPTVQPTPTPVPTPVPTMPPTDAISAELAKPGSLTVCMALMGAPASSLDLNGKPQGYNVAFANAFADHLNLTPVIQQVVFNELQGDLVAHTCDITVSSQNITSDRLAQMNLVPYTQAKSGFPVVVAFGNPQGIETTTNLCGQAVSAAKGTTNVDAVNGTGQYTGNGINGQCQAAGLQPVNLDTFNAELDALQALLDGSVVAYLGNANYVSQYPTLIQDSAATLPSAEQGVGVALDHPALTTAIEAALGAMIADGNYVNLLMQFMSAPSVEDVSIAN